MATNKRVFIAFAIEDKFARDNLVYQAKHQENCPLILWTCQSRSPGILSGRQTAEPKFEDAMELLPLLAETLLKPTALAGRLNVQKRKVFRSKVFGFIRMIRAVNPRSLATPRWFTGLGTIS
jgi:hypothetical protein